MRVLLTGHNGYIGVVLAPMLQKAGHEVTGLDSDLFTAGTFGQPDRIDSLRMDVRDVAVDHLDGFDAVIHLAGISNDPLGDLNPQCTFEINHLASVHIAELAKQAGVTRFLYASSCSMYGAGSDRDSLDESSPFNPVTPYARAKVLAEQDLQTLADANFSPTFLRCATAYGFSPRLRADLVVNNLTGYAFLRGEVFMKSDGLAWRPLVHIEDISRAYLTLLEALREKVHNEAFNVGRSQENYQVKDVAELVQRAVPNCKITFAKGAGADQRCYIVDCSKLEKQFPEYRPTWTVEKGIHELYKAYGNHKVTADQLLGPSHMRIDRIKQLIEAGEIDQAFRRTGYVSNVA